jgi:hypothetical protein
MKPPKETPIEFFTIDAGLAERTGVLGSLRNRIPNILDEMIDLLTNANKDCENHLHQFAFDLSSIVHLYGRRFRSRAVNYAHPDVPTHPDYIANQIRRREKLEIAVQALTGLKSDLGELDVEHLEKFIAAYRTPTGRTTYSGPLELFYEIDLATRIIMACQAAHSSTFGVTPKMKGRKPVPYVGAARELINLWETYTGKKVPVSKTHQHNVTNKAAKFICLGISIIDSEVTDANVVTAINNALSS